MPINTATPTVDSYVSASGGVYLFMRPPYSGMNYQMQEACPQPLFTSSEKYIADGQWWDVSEPLSQGSMDVALTEINHMNTTDWALLRTKGPGLALSETTWIPATYQVVAHVPERIVGISRTVAYGLKRHTESKIAEFDKVFWTEKRNALAWKYIQSWLPNELPRWEITEARDVFMNGRRVPWMAAVSLASSRRHYFDLRHQYNSYVLGRSETEEEREQRLGYSRDARVMAAFYRAFTSPDGKASLLRKTKRLGARRLANAYDRAHKEVYDKLEGQFFALQGEVNTWVENAYKENN